jgi:methionyl-tRNA formyltransferase
MRDLRIIFMGTPEFAVASLEILVANGYNIVAVITAPDRNKGRGRKVMSSPVKEAAVSFNIPVLQPTNLKSPEFQQELKSFNANLQVVVAFRMLPEAVWNMPALGTFNLHASLLPQYRGAAPINWAIINGEQETGVTTFFLAPEIDTGEIIMQEKEPILEDDTVGDLYGRLMKKGASLVLKTVQAIEQDNVMPQAQVAAGPLKPAPKIFRETCEINWRQPAAVINNFVRGLNPYPAAWTIIDAKICKIYTVRPDSGPENVKPGTLETDNKSFLRVKTEDGWLAITSLQMQGKKRLDIEDFLRGNQIQTNQSL